MKTNAKNPRTARERPEEFDNQSNVELVEGYDLDKKRRPWTLMKTLSLLLALIFIIGLWLALDQKLLFGQDWMSDTYDNPDWRTNEGNLHTFGAWDLETHIWKTEYIMRNFPNHQWNPFWYLGMPLLKYYQSGFYFLNIFVVMLTGFSAAKAALMMVIFGHLLATLLTFLVCYKISKKIWVSALCSSFVLSNTFLSLRSYGWEPVTVVFLFLFPLGLYIFFKEPLRPFRFWLIVVLGLSYIAHPLIWFSLCMTMGLYLLSIAIRLERLERENIIEERDAHTRHYMLQLVGIVILSLLIGALQFIPQLSYKQVTSGAHMGVQYLPFYQVAPNIISIEDFFFDAGNLKGPGPVVMIAFFMIAMFTFIHYISRRGIYKERFHHNALIMGLTITILVMVLFYYLEYFNIFPMNFLRSIQYHRIIPEFVIISALLVASFSNILYTHKQKMVYYSMLIAFVLASGIIIYSVQNNWVTTSTIADRPEFIYDKFEGRISFPYTDQSFAVRNSFTYIPQAYGYYEQGITNAYADEIFSVSSGYHNAKLTILYLQATDVTRLYVNLQEGERDKIVITRLNGTLPLIQTDNVRYAYFEIPINNPALSQAVDMNEVYSVQKLEPGCRVIFQEKYCGSVKEEFVSTDAKEIEYLTAYVNMLEKNYSAKANMIMQNPDEYLISVQDAQESTGVIVKMTHDPDFVATVNNNEIPITSIGPDFMLISPGLNGDYTIKLEYRSGKLVIAGLIISLFTILLLAIYFLMSYAGKRKRRNKKGRLDESYDSPFYLRMKRGDMK